MNKEPLRDEELLHPVNETLLGAATKIKTEKKGIRERLEKLDANRQGVSESVYQRVRSDYIKQLDQASQKLQAMRKELDAELVAFAEKKNLIEGHLKLHSERMEEVKLRHSLGEYSAEEFDKVAKEETTEIQRLESALIEISTGLARFEEILEGEGGKSHPLPPEKPTGSVTQKQTGESTSKVSLEEKKLIPQLNLIEDGKVVQTVLVEGTIEIGRSPSNDIVLKDAKVSRQHAQVQVAGGKFILLDLESSNGTFVGGKKISEHALKPNDEIKIGKSTLIFKM